MERIVTGILIAASLLTLTSCRTRTLYNPPPTDFSVTNLEKVEAAILNGMTRQGWAAEVKQPGLIEGRLDLGRHAATVQVEYSDHEYQISYVSSQKMMYERHTDGSVSIHRNYNTYIRDLEKEIDFNLGVKKPSWWSGTHSSSHEAR